jgi:hypothetical protein
MRSRKHLKSSGVEKQVVVNVIELIENRHKNPFYDEPVKRKKNVKRAQFCDNSPCRIYYKTMNKVSFTYLHDLLLMNKSHAAA